MTDPTADNPGNSPTNPPEPPNPQPQPVPPPNPAPEPQSPGPNQALNSRELLAAVNALPEKLVNAFREATQPPAPVEPPKAPTVTKTEDPPKETAPTGAKKFNFAEWWVNG